MEHKINDIINYNHNGETIYLKVVEDFDCINCFFYSAACCSDIRNDIGDCLGSRRTDKTPVIFKKVTNKTMNENIDLTKILKDCPKGTKLYSTIFGYINFKMILNGSEYPIRVYYKAEINERSFTKDGKMINNYDAECTLFPSKEQRDWSKFTAPWYKKDKFDPKTLKPFDKVLVRYCNAVWECNIFSHICNNIEYPYCCISDTAKYCIPYNDNTKHLVGTTDEAPKYYRYWEE